MLNVSRLDVSTMRIDRRPNNIKRLGVIVAVLLVLASVVVAAKFFVGSKKQLGDNALAPAPIGAVPAVHVTEKPIGEINEKSTADQGSRLTPSIESLPKTVGSEGYGPTIMVAIDACKPEQCVEAANLIEKCRNIGRDAELVHKLGADPSMQKINAGYVKTVEWVQAEQRRCQTVTPDMAPVRGQLLLKAVEGGASGAAASYINEMRDKGGIDPAKRGLVLSALRADGRAGDTGALILLFTGDADFSETALDRRAYKLAFQVISDLKPAGSEAIVLGALRNVMEKLDIEWRTLDSLSNEKMTLDIQDKVSAIVRAHQLSQRPKSK